MLEKKMFINEENGAYYGVQNNEEFNSLAVDALKDDGVCIASYVGKAADYIKEIFNELSTVNKIKLFLFVEKQNTKRSPYLVPETMVSLMEKYADEWCADDEITPLEFVNEDQEEFLAWAEDYVEGWFPDSFNPDYWDLKETLEYLESIEKNFMYTTITGYSQGEFYYCLKLLATVEEKKYFEDLFAGDYLHDATVSTLEKNVTKLRSLAKKKKCKLKNINNAMKQVRENYNDYLVEVKDAIQTFKQLKKGWENYQIHVGYSDDIYYKEYLEKLEFKLQEMHYLSSLLMKYKFFMQRLEKAIKDLSSEDTEKYFDLISIYF